jgi:hypothetical protein
MPVQAKTLEPAGEDIQYQFLRKKIPLHDALFGSDGFALPHFQSSNFGYPHITKIFFLKIQLLY